MLLARVFICIAYPFTLLAGSVIRANIVSFLYFLIFALSVVLLPHRVLPKQVTISKLFPLLTLILSICSLILTVLVYTVPSLETSNTIQDFGYYKYNESVEIFLHVFPDVVVLFGSLIASILWRKYLIFGVDKKQQQQALNELYNPTKINSNSKYPSVVVSSNIDNQQHNLNSNQQQQQQQHYQRKEKKQIIYRPPSRTLTGFSFITLVLSSVSFPSVINAFYFIFVIGFILCLSGRISIHKLMIRTYPFFLTVSLLHLIFIYLFQIPVVYYNYSNYISDWYGIRNNMNWDSQHWPMVTGYIMVLFLYISSCLILRMHLLYIQTKPRYRAAFKLDVDPVSKKQISTRLTQLAILFSKHGWSICCIEIIVTCFFLTPSIYTTILLFFGLISTLLPLRIFKMVTKAILGYLFIFIIGQYAFNIPSPLKQTSQSETIGLIIWEPNQIWLKIGVQVVLAFTFGLYCFYSDIKPEDYIQKKEVVKEKEISHKQHPKQHHHQQEVLINVNDDLNNQNQNQNELKKRVVINLNQNTTTTSTNTNNSGGRIQQQSKKPLPPLPPSKKLPPVPMLKTMQSYQQLPRSPSNLTVDGYGLVSPHGSGGGNMMDQPPMPSFTINLPTTILSDSFTSTWNNFKQVYGDKMTQIKTVTKVIIEVCFVAILGQSYRIALVGLFFCGLTKVNLLNAGYMLFFILFALSEYLASKLWLFLILYAQMVLLLLYLWQMSWSYAYENQWTALVGVTHYESQELWIALIWHLVIITFTLTQWNVNKLYRQGLFTIKKSSTQSALANNNENKEEDGVANDQVPRILKIIGLVGKTVAQTYIALPICYMVIVVVCAFAKLSIISMVYMATVFLCLVIHNRSANGALHIRRFWGIVVFSQAAILVARYVYQFIPVYNWLNTIFPTNDYITLDDIGLILYDSDSVMFKELFGNVAILVVCVYQLSCFFSSNDSTEDYKELSEELGRMPILEKLIYCLGRFTHLHGPKIVLWTVFLVALSNLNFFNFLYLVMIVISMVFKKGTYRIGFYILIYSQLLVLTQMAALFPRATQIGHLFLINWIGLGRLGQNQFHLIKLNLVVILVISLQQVSYWWNKKRLVQESNDKKDDDGVEKQELLNNDIHDDGIKIVQQQPPQKENNNNQNAGVETLGSRYKWYVTHFYELYGLEILFIVITLSLCWRVNVLGIVYLVVIAIGLNVQPQHRHRLIYFSTLMIPIILGQYLCFLGFPTPDQHLPNWTPLTFNLLAITSPSQYILVLDFAILFCSMLLFKQPNHGSPNNKLFTKYSKNFLRFDDNDFTIEPRPWYSELRYIIIRFSTQLTLIVIFIAGTSECDIVSSGYVLFAVYVLFSGNAHSRRWSGLWTAMMVYNWCVLLLQILFQLLFVFKGENDTTTLIASVVGFSVVQPTRFNTAKNTISDAIIMILLVYQKNIYESEDFKLLERHVKSKRESAYETALEFYRGRRLERIKQLDSIQSILEQRRSRLQALKQRSHNKRHSLHIDQDRPSNHLFDYSYDNNNNNSINNNNNSRINDIDEPSSSSSPYLPQQQQSPQHNVRFLEDPIIIDNGENNNNNNNNTVQEEEKKDTKPDQPSFIKKWFNTFLNWLDPIPNMVTNEQPADGLESMMDENNTSELPELKSLAHMASNNRNSVYIDPEEIRIAMQQQQQQQQQQQLQNNQNNVPIVNLPSKDDDVFKRIVRGSSRICRDESKWIAFMACLANGIFNASIISLVYLLSVFLYGRLFESPRPSKMFWRFLIGYSSLVLCVKYIFQIPMFCIVSEEMGPVYEAFQGCWNPKSKLVPISQLNLYLSIPYKLGIYTIDGHFLAGAFWDLAVFLCCLWHRHVYRSKGLWSFEEKDFQESSPIFEFEMVDDDQQQQNQQNQDQQQEYDEENEDEMQQEEIDIQENNNNNAILTIQQNDGISESNQDLLLVDANSNQFDSQEYYIRHTPSSQGSQSPMSRGLSSSTQLQSSSILLYFFDKFKAFLIGIYHYVWLVTNTSEKTGRDYYIPIFFTDFCCLLFLIVFPQNFTGIPSSDITQFLEQNIIPRQYVIILILQFAIIILDRVIYLYKSVKAKFALQIILTLLYHGLLFFYFPDLLDKPFDFTYTKTLVLFYVLKCIYLYYSALQICYGYPILTEGRFLMDGYSDFHNIGFAIYRAIPFVFEMRTLLDWIATDTTLLFYDWLKFEDLYALVFSVHCRQEWIKRQGRKYGQKQPMFEKFITGVTLFVGLAVLLYFPLIILSSGLPGSNIEPVSSVQLTISINGWSPFININQDLTISGPNGTGGIASTMVTNSQFLELRNNSFLLQDEQSGTQIITINTFSEQSWDLTTPARQQLMEYLMYSQLSITAAYTITRTGTINVNIPGSNSVQMTQQQQMDLYRIINGTSLNNQFNVTGLLNTFIRLPGVSGSLLYPSNPGQQPQTESVLFTMFNGNVNDNSTTTTDEPYWQISNIDGSQLYFYTISSKLPNGLTSTLVSAGIIGLYVGVVLSVGRFLRLYVTGMSLRITLENMACCDEMEKMIDDVFIARQYCDLELEEDLYRELIDVVRQPQRLYELTKGKDPKKKQQ